MHPASLDATELILRAPATNEAFLARGLVQHDAKVLLQGVPGTWRFYGVRYRERAQKRDSVT